MRLTLVATLLVLVVVMAVVVVVLFWRAPVTPFAKERFEGATHGPTVIGIEGPACSGKTTLTRTLQKLLEGRGYRVKVHHQDGSTTGIIGVPGMNKARLVSEALCRPFISNVRTRAAHNKYDFILVEGINCMGRCGAQSISSLVHLKVYLLYRGSCVKDGRRSRWDPRVWNALKTTDVTRDSDVSNHHVYSTDGADANVLADAVLRKALRTHLRRAGDLVET